MKSKDLLTKVFSRRIKDYSFQILFFLIFAVFLFFAIRPNLVTAFRLLTELSDLKIKYQQYEAVILNIVNYQTLVEQTREDVALLDEAVPGNPKVYAFVNDIQKAAAIIDVAVVNLDVSPVVLEGNINNTVVAANAGKSKVQTRPKLGAPLKSKSYEVKFQLTTNIETLKKFLAIIANQRRIKLFKTMNISGRAALQGKGNYVIVFQVDGAYL